MATLIKLQASDFSLANRNVFNNGSKLVEFISVANNCSKCSNEIVVFFETLQMIQKIKFFKHYKSIPSKGE